MSIEAIFTLELLLVVAVIAVIVAGAAYLTLRNRQAQRGETGHWSATAYPPVGTERDGATDGSAKGTTLGQAPRREIYKGMALESSEEMKLRLYSPDEYESELAGDGDALSGIGFVAALKTYRMSDEEWYDYNPHRAADALELAPGDYEVDRERQVLLLRRLPPGMPISARDAL